MNYPNQQTDPAVLYYLAKREKDRAKHLRREVGPNSMSDSCNERANGYLIANEGRTIQ